MQDEPEEMSMNEVLSSIRQMLSDEKGTEELDNEMEEIFLLTPAMRVKEDGVLTLQEKMKAALTKLAEKKPDIGSDEYRALVKETVQPLLKEWLMDRMPELLEEAVDKEINKLLD